MRVTAMEWIAWLAIGLVVLPLYVAVLSAFAQVGKVWALRILMGQHSRRELEGEEAQQ